MVSFILIAKEKEKRKSYVTDYAEKQKVAPVDITTIEKDTAAKSTTTSIGIETVKQMQKNLYFKPIKSTNKLIVLEDAHLLTTEAQNALLKVLEEPPEHTHIILGTESREALLPTILSRCQIIELQEENKQLAKKTREELQLFIQSLPELSLSDRLKKAEQLAKDKEKAITWIENLILILREQIVQTYTDSDSVQPATRNPQLVTIKSFQSLHTLLKTTNVNPRFAIEHTLLLL